jgi:SAM-dependent methyltransferase
VADFNDHFSSRAAAYAKFRPHYPPELFDFLTQLAPARQLAWDCACGNGQATIDLAQRFERVIATDASEAQIANAMRRPNIDYRVALADNSGLADASVDLATVAQALHWFKLDAFYREADRTLRPGGILAVWTYGCTRIDRAEIDAITNDFYANIVGPFWPPERAMVEDEYRSIPFPTPQVPAPEFRMRMKWTLDQFLGYLSSWSATKNYIQARGENPIEPLAHRLQKCWGDQTRLVEWPLAIRIWRKP